MTFKNAALSVERDPSKDVYVKRPAMNAALTNYIAGVAGGVAVVLVGHPFDTTKTRMQTAPASFYSGTLDCCKKTLRHEGIGGFYAGITSPLLGQMFFRAASFMTFYGSIGAINGGDHAPSPQTIFAAGGVTGFVISFIETPIDLIKTKLQIQIFASRASPGIKPLYTTFSGCVKHVVKEHGARALYQGWSSTAIRNVPANAMFFPVNEIVKQKFAEMEGVPVTQVSTPKKLLSGAIAGMSYWTLLYPLDAIKGRAMAETYGHRQTWLNIVRSMAFKDFFTGIVPCTVRAVAACSAMFYTVDVMRNALNQA